MQARAPRRVSILSGTAMRSVAIACVGIWILGMELPGMPVANGAPITPPAKSATAKHNGPRGASPRGQHRGLAARAHGPRSGASQEAARLGAAVGHECSGRAAMQRDEHQWIVLCSNGKAFVLEMPPGQGAATQCSLAGSGPEPACFR
jgi:hypothetical protein